MFGGPKLHINPFLLFSLHESKGARFYTSDPAPFHIKRAPMSEKVWLGSCIWTKLFLLNID